MMRKIISVWKNITFNEKTDGILWIICTKSISDVHACCSNCWRGCQCAKCSQSRKIALKELINQQKRSAETIPITAICTVSDHHCTKIASILKQYKIHLCTFNQKFGNIDLATGFTHSPKNSVVKNYECFTLADSHQSNSLYLWTNNQ